MKKLLLIDGNSILNRAFYGTQGSTMKNAEGLFTGAVYGFLNIYFKHMEEEDPDYVCVAFDLKAPTFRHKYYDGYKATRKGMPQELAMQMPVMKKVLTAMNVSYVEIEGYEADDIIGTYSALASSEGMECIIVTGDRDSFQLISENVKVKLCKTSKGKPVDEIYDTERLKEEFGLTPLQMIELKALMGDSSDNIPGIPGVGEKTALQLLADFGTVEGVYNHVEDIKKESLKQKIIDNKELCMISRYLGTINKEVPVEKEINDLKVREYDNDCLYQEFQILEFHSYIKKLGLSPKYKDDNEDFGQLSLFDCAYQTTKESQNTDITLQRLIERVKETGIMYILHRIEDHIMQYMIISPAEGEKYQEKYDNDINFTQTLSSLKDLFEDNSIKKVFFEAKSFILYLKKIGITLQGLSFDASVAAYIADSTRKNQDFSGVCRYFTGKSIPENVFALKEVVAAADVKLKGDGLDKLYYGVELPLIEVLADMEYYGFNIDRGVLINEGEVMEESLDKLTNKIYELAGTEFNINSPKQLGEVLFEKLQIGKGKKSKTGYSTNQEVLEGLADAHPIVPLIMEYRQNKKLKSTYVDGLINIINDKTGRVYSTFHQTVTATGRLSSTEPNLQNIPIRQEMGRRLRRAFIPGNDQRIIIDADYSQIELRVLAAMSGDENMVNAFLNGQDIHTITAAQVHGIPPEMVTSQMRREAKAVNFGIVYGISEFGLSRDLGISRYEAKKYKEGYFRQYPGVKAFMDQMIESAKAKGYAQTLLGRRRYLPELEASKAVTRMFGERVAMNMPIQGTAADIIKLAMIDVSRRLKAGGYKSELILQVHDELLIDAYKDEADKVVELLVESMKNAFNLGVPLEVSVSMGESWYDCKE